MYASDFHLKDNPSRLLVFVLLLHLLINYNYYLKERLDLILWKKPLLRIFRFKISHNYLSNSGFIFSRIVFLLIYLLLRKSIWALHISGKFIVFPDLKQTFLQVPELADLCKRVSKEQGRKLSKESN